MKISKIIIIALVSVFIISSVYAHSARHHVIDMGKSIIEAVFSPLYGIFIKGPKNVKEAYQYEVHEREDPQKRGLMRYKLFAIWRAPGEEAKGVIDGIVGSVKSLGNSLKEFISIFFSD